MVRPQGTLPLVVIIHIENRDAKYMTTLYGWDAKHVHVAGGTPHIIETQHFITLLTKSRSTPLESSKLYS